MTPRLRIAAWGLGGGVRSAARLLGAVRDRLSGVRGRTFQRRVHRRTSAARLGRSGNHRGVARVVLSFAHLVLAAVFLPRTNASIDIESWPVILRDVDIDQTVAT
jgi:hypothetical protein